MNALATKTNCITLLVASVTSFIFQFEDHMISYLPVCFFVYFLQKTLLFKKITGKLLMIFMTHNFKASNSAQGFLSSE